MVDKIIIDGVDVSGCDYLSGGKCLAEYSIQYGDEITDYANCSDCEDCYYKQLQRKTSECKELKEELAQEILRNNDCYKQFNELKKALGGGL